MSWYYSVIEILVWIFLYFMLRHMIYRGRYLLHIFQQSGYKFNEFFQWLSEHWRTILFPASNLALLLATLVSHYYLDSFLTTSAITIALIIFSISWFGSVSRYSEPQVKKPLVFTARMIRLTMVFSIIVFWILLFGSIMAFEIGILYPDIYFLMYSWVIADLILPTLLILAAGMVYPVEQLIQRNFKRLARKKIKKMPDLKVIAITGSYGKTSTKFMIEAILNERYRVCSTPGSYNTPMGICKVINNDLQHSDQVLILEMGARYAGNIDELCRIAQPDVAVVTNVGIAHLESFGSIEAIARTKKALIDHLKPGGVAILNGDDEKVRKMADRTDISVWYAGLSEKYNHLSANDITHDEKGCSFKLMMSQSLFRTDTTRRPMESEKITVTMSFLGEHSVQNALLASAVGLVMGLRLPTIKIALKKVAPVEHRLELKQHNGIMVIDDAFNSNPVGAKNAVSVLSSFQTGRRYVITPGMIELGDRQEEENLKFGYWMAESRPDHIYLVGKNQTRPIYNGLIRGGFDQNKISVVNSLFEANDLLKKKLKKGDVVLYENDLPDTYSEH
ncbi:MAG: UDP-N-acetylmuramoyl-tripeptide--D-alanyl-D-alanine ligase [Balneolales bacterium]